VSLAILLPAVLLLATFLTQWENRISRASFFAELPFFTNAIENCLRKSTTADLPPRVSPRWGRDGEIEILPADVGSVGISFTQLADLPAVQCDISGPRGQINFICPRY
jgi:hypothetical protein